MNLAVTARELERAPAFCHLDWLESEAVYILREVAGECTNIAGLVFGGLFAAPFAALLCRKLSARTLLVLVGTLIGALSFFNLYRALLP